MQCLILLVLLTDLTCNLLLVSHIMYMQPTMCCKILLLLCRSKLNGRIYFAGRFIRVFDRDQNNCCFDSAVKNTNMPQIFLQHRLVLTGTILQFHLKRTLKLTFIFPIFSGKIPSTVGETLILKLLEVK